jgi:hypothetical protein
MRLTLLTAAFLTAAGSANAVPVNDALGDFIPATPVLTSPIWT